MDGNNLENENNRNLNGNDTGNEIGMQNENGADGQNVPVQNDAGFDLSSQYNGGMENNPNTSNRMFDYMPQQIPVPDMNVPQAPQQKKKGKWKIAVIIACAAAALAVAVGVGMAAYNNSPKRKIEKGFENLAEELSEVENPLWEKIGAEDIARMLEKESSHVGTKLNFSMDTFMGSITLGVDTDAYKSMKSKKMYTETALSMMNYELANLYLYGDTERIIFSLPELYLEDMYFYTDNIARQYNNSYLAEIFGEVDLDDFSLELFPEEEEISASDLMDVQEMLKRYAGDIAACKESMTIEKADDGLYRVTYGQAALDRLAWDMVETLDTFYETMDLDVKELFEDYDSLVDSDVSFVLEIDKKNRINGIVTEKEIKLLDGETSLNAEIFFLGEERSIDKIQGKITIEDEYGDETKIVCQMEQTPADDFYGMTLEMKYTDAYTEEGRLSFSMDCDADRDEMKMNLSLWDDEDDFDIALEGEFENIEEGKSFDFSLDKLTFSMDGEQLYKITGECTVEPLKEEINMALRPGTEIFAMTEDDWDEIFYQWYDMLDDLDGLLDW